MNIYLRHPQHGTKVAICDLEAKADKLNGWAEFDPYEEKVEPIPEKEKRPELEVLREEWEKRHGKPPHHKKTVEGLRKELEA